MAWNEPGGGNKDPWGNNNQGPPDLEEAIKKLQGKLGSLFGGKPKGPRPVGPDGDSSGGADFQLPFKPWWLLIIGGLIWFMSGFYIVDPAEEAVVTRFGAYNRTAGEGPHWLPTFIEHAELVNVRNVRKAEIGFRNTGRSKGTVPDEALMLTQDQNIIDLEVAVQYRIKDAKDYLFKVRDPDVTLRHATESALREVVGHRKMDFILTAGREEIATATQLLMQEILDRYATGLNVTSVNLGDAQPPAQVQEAFDDAIKAEEDEERLKNEAQAYANDILPKARGDAAALRERAEAYKQRVTAIATGEAARFTSILREYKKAPEVTRERLYLDAVESVLGSTSKILLEEGNANNLMMLPLDKLMGNAAAGATLRREREARDSNNSSNSRAPFDANRTRGDDFRTRTR